MWEVEPLLIYLQCKKIIFLTTSPWNTQALVQTTEKVNALVTVLFLAKCSTHQYYLDKAIKG